MTAAVRHRSRWASDRMERLGFAMTDHDPMLDGIQTAIDAQKARYSEQSDPSYFLCRDCGSIVKHGWLSMHDGLHSAIGYPVYPENEEES